MAGYQVGRRTLPTWLPAADALVGYRDRQVLLGLRAEDVHENPRPEHGALSGLVATVEYLVRMRLSARWLITRPFTPDSIDTRRCDRETPSRSA